MVQQQNTFVQGRTYVICKQEASVYLRTDEVKIGYFCTRFHEDGGAFPDEYKLFIRVSI